MLKFHCKHCSGKIGVKDEYAGKRVRCPKCKEPVRVPAPEPETEDSDEFDLEMLSEGDGFGGGDAASDLAALAAMEDEADVTIQSADNLATTCPACGNQAKPGAALCVSCGYNFKNGKQLNTAVSAAPKSSKRQKQSKDDDEGDPPWKNILWGLFLIAVSAGIWWYFWDFENSTDQSRSVNQYIAFLYNLGGKWLASLPFTFIGLFMLIWGLRGKKI